MVVDINISEKSFGPANLMDSIRFSVNNGEKIGVIGRNGIGKTTLFNMIAGLDRDFQGEIIFGRGVSVVMTSQEHHTAQSQTVMQYVLAGLPEYLELSDIIENYPSFMGDDLRKINQYSNALERFNDKGFYQIEEKIKLELENFQLGDVSERLFSSLSGGQKRLIEVVKVMHSNSHLALIDEPTNHMDYVAKKQFIDWMKSAKEAMLIITHDRDVLKEVDRIIELKDGKSFSYKGNYDDYLTQNTVSTSSGMNEYEVTLRKIENLRQRIQYARSKKASWGGTADKRNPFVVMENKALREIKELEKIEKPSFWIDRESAQNLDYKSVDRYQKYKARNIRMSIKSDESRSRHVLVNAKNFSLGYESPLFDRVNIDLREGESLEIRGRNGSGKTTLIKALLGSHEVKIFEGEASIESHVRVGIYEQEISKDFFDLPLSQAVERIYLDKNMSITDQKIRQLLSDYLFKESDISIPIAKLSGGQKARFQLIKMLMNDPQLLILDEPTNHLDLPSIEELEIALEKYSGAIIYVSHDNYFRKNIGGQIVQIG